MIYKAKRDPVLILMRCWTVLIPSLFFSYVTDTVHMAFLALAASIIAFFRKETIQITLRSVIYTIVLALTVIVLTNTIFKIDNRFYLTPSEMGIPTALVFAIALLFYDDRPSFSASILVLAVFSIMMCGDITDHHIVRNLPLPAVMGRLETVKLVYVISLVLCVIPFFYLMNRSHNKLRITNQSSKMAIIKYSLVFFSFCLVFICYKPTQNVVVPFTKDLESKMVRALSQWRFNKKKTAFQKNVDLKDSYFHLEGDALDAVLIRVESKRTPGYIRSRVYEAYHEDKGIWGSNDKPAVMDLKNEDHEFSFNTFSFNGLYASEEVKPKRDELERLDIYYSGNFRVENILHQGKSKYIEMTCETLSQTDSGTVTGNDIDFSGGVTLFNDKGWSSEDAYDGPVLNEENRKPYTFMSFNYKHTIRRFVESIDILDNETDDPKLFAASIAKFFNAEYTYELGVKFTTNEDPVIEFLKGGTDRKGHCEYFATTAVMMLRSKDIPARYVTGFYCQELHPNGQYYLGRSKDLHAWVEFYDDKTKKWYLLEPTPSNGLPSGNGKFNFFSENWDAFKKRWQDLLSNIVRGYFADSIIMFIKGLWDMIIWCFSSVPKAIISCLILFIWFKLRQKKIRTIPLGKEIEVIHKDIQKVLTKLSKVKGLTITDSMTIREIMEMLKQKGNEQLSAYISCLEEYESVRYNPKLRSSENIQQIRSKISLTLNTRIGKLSTN